MSVLRQVSLSATSRVLLGHSIRALRETLHAYSNQTL